MRVTLHSAYGPRARASTVTPLHHPTRRLAHWWLGAFAAMAACGEAPGGSLPARDAAVLRADGATPHDAAPADAASPFTPGAPADGDAELSIFGAQDPDALSSVSEVGQGATLHGQFGISCGSCAHVYAGFELRSDELPSLDEEVVRRLETTIVLELLRPDGAVIARNEGLLFGLSVEPPGQLQTLAPVGLVVEGGRLSLPEPGELLIYRVTVPMPGGPTFVRQAWVTTAWPDV